MRTNKQSHPRKYQVSSMLKLLFVQAETVFHFDFFSSLDSESFHTLKSKRDDIQWIILINYKTKTMDSFKNSLMF